MQGRVDLKWVNFTLWWSFFWEGLLPTGLPLLVFLFMFYLSFFVGTRSTTFLSFHIFISSLLFLFPVPPVWGQDFSVWDQSVWASPQYVSVLSLSCQLFVVYFRHKDSLILAPWSWFPFNIVHSLPSVPAAFFRHFGTLFCFMLNFLTHFFCFHELDFQHLQRGWYYHQSTLHNSLTFFSCPEQL